MCTKPGFCAYTDFMNLGPVKIDKAPTISSLKVVSGSVNRGKDKLYELCFGKEGEGAKCPRQGLHFRRVVLVAI